MSSAKIFSRADGWPRWILLSSQKHENAIRTSKLSLDQNSTTSTKNGVLQAINDDRIATQDGSLQILHVPTSQFPTSTTKPWAFIKSGLQQLTSDKVGLD